MYPINEFKYAVLLTALEKIKGTKGPIDKFIKKVYKETDNLDTRDLASLRYAFMIITRAIDYRGAITKCNSVIRNRLDFIADILSNQVITADNVLQTFEFWPNSICFNPKTLTDLKRIDGIMRILKEQKLAYTMYDWIILEIKHLEHVKRNFSLKMFVTSTIGTDSPILATLSLIPSSFDPTLLIASFEETINNLQIILKEAHEQHSRSSDAV